jgi:uncharacterized protein YbcI
MKRPTSNVAQRIARVASALEQERSGRTPKSVLVVLSDDLLVITLQGALSAAEKELCKTPAGAAQVEDLHRRLFAISSESLRREIRRITGTEVLEASAGVETPAGTVVEIFSSGAIVLVFLLAHSLPPETWGGRGEFLEQRDSREWVASNPESPVMIE